MATKKDNKITMSEESLEKAVQMVKNETQKGIKGQKSTQILIRLPNDLAEKLKTEAEEQDRTLSGEVSHILKKYFADKKNTQ